MEITVCDIGGRYGLHRSWGNFVLPVGYYSFDGDPEEAARLSMENPTDSNLNQIKVVSGAIAGSSGNRLFYLYDSRHLSSLYKLNTEGTYRYSNAVLEDTIEIQTITLDQFAERENIEPNFISIDAQGATLEIFQGGLKVLKDCIGIRCEIEFFNLYHQAPCAGEVLNFMDRIGYKLLRFELCGSENFGVSTEMNNFSVSPWDAKPSSCDAIYINSKKVEELVSASCGNEQKATELAYLVTFCIHNGCGYYGLEIIENIYHANNLKQVLSILPENIRSVLASTCNFYLQIPRLPLSTQFGEKLNFDYNHKEISLKFFENSSYDLPLNTREKILKIYGQQYSPLS